MSVDTLAVRPAERTLRVEAGPRALAAFRIAVGLASLLFVAEFAGSQLPPEHLRFLPSGTAWLDFLPVSQGLFAGAVVLLVGSSVAVVVGWRPRLTASLAAAFYFYTGWVITHAAAISHDHHVMWALLLVAVSPSANAWAVRPEKRGGSCRWPIAAVMILLGLIYFGAGLPKLAHGDWDLSVVVRNMAWVHDMPLPFWIDWPLVPQLLSTVTIVFELAFLPLILHPATRRWIWPIGLMFHVGTWVILGIPFFTLQLMYVVFIPWDRLATSETVADSPPTVSQRRLAAGLITAVAVFALSGVENSWPLAAYPSFAGAVAQPGTVDIEVTTSGETVWLMDHPIAQQVDRYAILPFGRAALHNNPVAFRDWLEADTVTVVLVDTSDLPLVTVSPVWAVDLP